MKAEVTNISATGIWILLDDIEKFLSYVNFPWFQHATVFQIIQVERLSPHHLYWPDLDVDIHTDAIDHPERYPLRAKVVLPETTRQPV